MTVWVVGQAAGMFAVTNIDDILLLALFFAQAKTRAAALRVVAGQYLGFGAILAVAVVGALGATLLPEPARAYLGLIPLALGIRAAWQAWRRNGDDEGSPVATGIGAVAAVTLANGGDNIGVYVPVFATAARPELAVYVVVFLALTAVWCAAGWFFATRPAVARALSRWGHVILPVVLIGIGIAVLLS